ncbi:hypothetical protein BKA62DRAFT_680637 [Auriculariales sp. MPI-PUGE-AT-0066]|nr:hypothetical protein BKA62DRAFT_680637 [Auriculariales sp. MPI-PUGE-AT-0066]
MHFATNDDRRVRLQADQTLLQQMHADHAYQTEELEKRRSALRTLQREIEQIRVDIDDLDARRKSLAVSIERRQTALPSHSWGALPCELATMVIDHLTADLDPVHASPAHGVWQSPPPAFQVDRVAMPFALAAVCKSWRQVVIAMPHAWSYIAVPPLSTPSERNAHISRVQRQLRLSQKCPIDVSIELADDWADDEAYIGMLNQLLADATRWRTLFLYGTWKARCPRAMDYLRAPTPILLHALVLFTDSQEDAEMEFLDPSPDYFPHAPMLCSARVQHAPIAFKARNAALGAMTALELHYDCYSLQRLGHTFQPLTGLAHLRIHWRLAFTDALAQNVVTISLPNLLSLDLQPPPTRRERLDMGFAAIINGLDTPELRKLTMTNDMVPLIQRYLMNVADVLEEVVLQRDRVERSTATLLRQLHQLERVSFVGMPVSSEFFNGLCEYQVQGTVPWPCLRTMCFDHAMLDAHAESSLVRVLRMRDQAGAAAAADSPGSIITEAVRVRCSPVEVVFTDTPVAPWVPAEARYLYAHMQR